VLADGRVDSRHADKFCPRFWLNAGRCVNLTIPPVRGTISGRNFSAAQGHVRDHFSTGSTARKRNVMREASGPVAIAVLFSGPLFRAARSGGVRPDHMGQGKSPACEWYLARNNSIAAGMPSVAGG
jgi:hypothetical protein